MKKIFVVFAISVFTTNCIAQKNINVTKTVIKNHIVNEKGYAVKILTTNQKEKIIVLSKNGITEKIKMSDWNAKPKYYNNKYGSIPPPPPPPPQPPLPPPPPAPKPPKAPKILN